MSDQQAGSELARRVKGTEPSSVQKARSGTAGLIEQMAPQFARALDKAIDPDRFTRLALTALNKDPNLRRCSSPSVLGALMTCAQLGLEPNTPTGEAYLIPYGDVATFVPGYQGLVKLAWQSGEIEEIYAELVYANDTFERKLGLHRDLIHVPADSGDRGAFRGCYAVVKFKGAGIAYEYMTAAQLDEHRRKYSKQKKGPWDEIGWMQKKTVLKQALKLAPKSTVRMERARALDGSVRTDLSFAGVDVVEGFADDDVVDGEVLAADGTSVDTETGEIQ